MIGFYKPQMSELWFKEKMLGDEKTMSYNHAYGGTVAFPKENWSNWYSKWILDGEPNRFYRYITVNGIFVGEAAYRFDCERQIYIADVIVYAPYRGKGYGRDALLMLCDAARDNGVVELYDDIASDNTSVSLFIKCGFEEILRTDEFVLVRKKLKG